MPDDVDYEWLHDLVAHPERWNDEDEASARLMIANQRQAIKGLHAKDVEGRRAAQAVVDQLEAALNAYLAGRESGR